MNKSNNEKNSCQRQEYLEQRNLLRGFIKHRLYEFRGEPVLLEKSFFYKSTDFKRHLYNPELGLTFEVLARLKGSGYWRPFEIEFHSRSGRFFCSNYKYSGSDGWMKTSIDCEVQASSLNIFRPLQARDLPLYLTSEWWKSPTFLDMLSGKKNELLLSQNLMKGDAVL